MQTLENHIRNERGKRMAATGAAEMMIRCVFNGSLSMRDVDIERRPYHGNCGCALHRIKAECGHYIYSVSKQKNISFSRREFKNKYCSLSLSPASAIYSQISILLCSYFDRELDSCVHI